MARRVETPGWALDHGPAADPAAYRPGPLPAGRGRLITRDGGVRLVQTALSEP